MAIVGSVITLDAIGSLLAVCLVLLLGTRVSQWWKVLERYSIPTPVVGGLLFAIAVAILLPVAGYRIVLATSAKSNLLLIFFACLGLTSDLRQLKRGGPRLLRFIVALVPFLIIQDALGVLLAKLLGMHPFLGLVAGSITLIGGHGTGAAYVERFGEATAIPGLMALTMTSATLGLVMGGLIGGPVGEGLIRRHRLVAPVSSGDAGGVITGPVDTPVTTTFVIRSITVAILALLIGRWVGGLLLDAPVTVPDFLVCLVAGLVLANAGRPLGLALSKPATDLVGSVSLSLFLAWTMMELDFGAVFSTAGPLLIILVAQAVLVAAWATFVSFRLVGRDYESAVMAAAFCGFSLGASATAIANMQSIADRHGPAPEAFLVIPLIGAFFIDIVNAGGLSTFLSFKMVGVVG